jgi:hypothetical protein
VPPSAVETGCRPYPSITSDRKCSATNIFLSFDILNERISLSFSSIIATPSHINS